MSSEPAKMSGKQQQPPHLPRMPWECAVGTSKVVLCLMLNAVFGVCPANRIRYSRAPSLRAPASSLYILHIYINIVHTPHSTIAAYYALLSHSPHVCVCIECFGAVFQRPVYLNYLVCGLFANALACGASHVVGDIYRGGNWNVSDVLPFSSVIRFSVAQELSFGTAIVIVYRQN